MRHSTQPSTQGPSAEAVTAPRPQERSRSRPLRRVPLLLAVPAVLFLLAFNTIPILAGMRYAFTNWTGFNTPHYVGLTNFKQAFTDPVARGALEHTLILAATFFVLTNVLGLVLALGLNRTLKSRNVLRFVFFLPVAMSPLAVGYVWSSIFAFNGALNGLLSDLGLKSWERAWTANPHWALWTILVAMVWQYSGLTMVIYLAGLQGISDELLEATAVDGASLWTRFRRVTLPLLAPAITVNATLTAIIGLRVFDQVVALTAGGPDYSSETLPSMVWRITFQDGQFGYGTALAVLLTILVAAVVLTQLAFLRAREARIQ